MHALKPGVRQACSRPLGIKTFVGVSDAASIYVQGTRYAIAGCTDRSHGDTSAWSNRISNRQSSKVAGCKALGND